MTSHIPGYDAGPRRRGGLTLIRQDIHVHASAATVLATLGDPSAYAGWLPPAMRDWRADTEGMAFILALPGRQEPYSLRRDASADPREVVYRVDEGGVAESLAWGLHREGARESHVTLEIAYRPATGLLGGAMETLVHRPQRIQVMRDLLWNLKRALERDGARPATQA